MVLFLASVSGTDKGHIGEIELAYKICDTRMMAATNPKIIKTFLSRSLFDRSWMFELSSDRARCMIRLRKTGLAVLF